ncbi:hypothetical protein SKAU_G00242660 [Synaphobranchus kaupii]|uniref:Uncharacterized protein n=1 Tax=Synaphobranchus kaupii TaxID=118154 RepID=A0A9Q1F806_SYNKA|nr:hypothetical protein SKAU_G00242660 [Synaphobranchus kaupii]
MVAWRQPHVMRTLLLSRDLEECEDESQMENLLGSSSPANSRGLPSLSHTAGSQPRAPPPSEPRFGFPRLPGGPSGRTPGPLDPRPRPRHAASPLPRFKGRESTEAASALHISPSIACPGAAWHRLPRREGGACKVERTLPPVALGRRRSLNIHEPRWKGEPIAGAPCCGLIGTVRGKRCAWRRSNHITALGLLGVPCSL